MKVLIVDDEKSLAEILCQRLKLRSIDTDVVFDGESALQYVSNIEPDVMVLDLNMPGMNGMEVLRKIKVTNPRIQVIIFTGHGSEHDEHEAKGLGAHSFLMKPANVNVLLSHIMAAYSNR
ncbi:MAG: response regulator [Nitrospirae bacterium]|nr:response regulator [Nitrospirota bacterium]